MLIIALPFLGFLPPFFSSVSSGSHKLQRWAYNEHNETPQQSERLSSPASHSTRNDVDFALSFGIGSVGSSVVDRVSGLFSQSEAQHNSHQTYELIRVCSFGWIDGIWIWIQLIFILIYSTNPKNSTSQHSVKFTNNVQGSRTRFIFYHNIHRHYS
jgi:hypothetical protein